MAQEQSQSEEKQQRQLVAGTVAREVDVEVDRLGPALAGPAPRPAVPASGGDTVPQARGRLPREVGPPVVAALGEPAEAPARGRRS